MKAAVIDLGTNTFHLIIANLEAGNGEMIYKTTVPVKLGEGRINENIIIPAAFERGLAALEAFAATIKSHEVDVVKATATSAVRSASNGKAFVEAALERSGIAIDVIDGDTEAALIYKGVQATGLITATSLVMDIGGGSTEFILCTRTEVLWKKSYNIGAARLMQAYFKSDPISEDEKSAIYHHLAALTAELLQQCEQHRPQKLIGSAGAFESFAGMLMIQNNRPANDIASGEINFMQYLQLSSRLIDSTHEQRLHMEGLIPLRVDMIVIAALLVNFVLENTRIRQLSLSTYDLKMGVLAMLKEDYNLDNSV
ncbi:Ppx/GppA phosphatase family protein [Pedobacter sp. SAFR-022]|uniref:Ppx/GppA phosphatase family protein n=1 Tax=Pedobacter sp. SAFR-022 TaxID=3436861 RepID=UPI003F7EDFEC